VSEATAMAGRRSPREVGLTKGAADGAADVLVVFGITGDLAKVMTFRSLYRLERRGLLDCPIVGVAVDDWSPDAVPVDISFGIGRPVVPVAAPTSVSRILLETHLPAFMLDAQRALELADITVRLAEDASIDVLTGLANRRTLDRLLARLAPVDTVVMIDLDHFKHVNDSLGHPEGDRVLRTLGRTLTASLRASDHAGRFGGEEFVAILRDGDEPEPFLTRLSLAWATARPHPITFSAGVAAAGPDPRRALQAADRALYRAKAAGRDQWQHAVPEDYL